ncbi:MAG: thioredoxin domain-containing protein [Chromatiales bacterium]|nr:thioredoxin domain-containing protein [Chromatiales bacterium]
MKPTSRNHLSEATSPYLLQHANNPVEWYPWGKEALELAEERDCPILLSIGYSACHWCHVMAHESFEDPQTAELMNRLYVNIKVDREERPDLDKIYQTAHQILAQRPGGWPLTMILTPKDRIPFFAGTYFPPQSRHGLPSFRDVLTQVRAFFDSNLDQIDAQNGRLIAYMESLTPEAGAENPGLDGKPLAVAVEQLQQSYDTRHGGFGQAPKFPHPTNLELLLRLGASGGITSEQLDMAFDTLSRMSAGGLYDQLGGGFCRYSVDDYWMIPHFEKMLYDNGPLLSLYVDAWQISGDRRYRTVAEETADWMIRDMQDPAGGFYSTLDADSEGEEGKFYVWTRDQVRAALEETEYPLFARRFGLDRPANFEGHWHLHQFAEFDRLAREFETDSDTIENRLIGARRKLLSVRNGRIWPARDEKILTAWNGLAIKGMARAGRLLGRPEYLESATRAVDFLRTNLWNGDRLWATGKDGRAHLNGYLDDYAFVLDALLELLQARWNSEHFAFALHLADKLLERFEDKREGGFFFTANDHETLIQRPKPFSDDATPAGNGIAAVALHRLGHLLGETRYIEAAERAVRLAWPALQRMPYAHTTLLMALEELLQPVTSVVIRGDQTNLDDWMSRLTQGYHPHRMVFAIPSDTVDLPGALATRSPRGEICAYLCRGSHCEPPVEDLASLRERLSGA